MWVILSNFIDLGLGFCSRGKGVYGDASRGAFLGCAGGFGFLIILFYDTRSTVLGRHWHWVIGCSDIV